LAGRHRCAPQPQRQCQQAGRARARFDRGGGGAQILDLTRQDIGCAAQCLSGRSVGTKFGNRARNVGGRRLLRGVEAIEPRSDVAEACTQRLHGFLARPSPTGLNGCRRCEEQRYRVAGAEPAVRRRANTRPQSGRSERDPSRGQCQQGTKRGEPPATPPTFHGRCGDCRSGLGAAVRMGYVFVHPND
jgi:hypothetical protein